MGWSRFPSPCVISPPCLDACKQSLEPWQTAVVISPFHDAVRPCRVAVPAPANERRRGTPPSTKVIKEDGWRNVPVFTDIVKHQYRSDVRPAFPAKEELTAPHDPSTQLTPVVAKFPAIDLMTTGEVLEGGQIRFDENIGPLRWQSRA